MRRRGQLLATVAMIAVVSLAAAACGSSGKSKSGSGGSAGSTASSGSNSGTGKQIVLGTTDKVISLDPAGAYDMGSWTLQWNIYQSLLKIKPGTSDIVNDAASKCSWTDTTTYTCTLNAGLVFSNGDALDANAVKYSIDRVIKINDPNGPSSLLGTLDNVSVQGADTVVFKLKSPNSVFPYILTTGAGNIVDPKVFPADKLLADSQVIGSGAYTLKSFTKDQQAVLAPNKSYKGDDVLANSGVVVHYEQTASTLKLDVEQGNVDVAWRSLSPTDVASLQKESDKVKVVTGNGIEIRYLVFNTSLAPTNNVAVRQAVAYSIDRDSIAKNVYNGTVQPLYSMVPQGLTGANTAYKDLYGAAPDPAKAKSVLDAAGVKTPVDITLWWTPSHYGAVSGDEYTELKRELESTGLFKVTLQSAEWDSYSKAYPADQYAAFQLGWFPDYPDADDYLAPFYVQGGFYKNHYDNPQIDQLITQEEGETDQTKRTAEIDQIQTLAAKDVPTIPIWQGNQVAATGLTVTGVDKTFDPSYTFRMWLIGKS
ncbi:MAG: ABC transporter substrate-binding protein [Acidothermaceae bacterium]